MNDNAIMVGSGDPVLVRWLKIFSFLFFAFLVVSIYAAYSVKHLNKKLEDKFSQGEIVFDLATCKPYTYLARENGATILMEDKEGMLHEANENQLTWLSSDCPLWPIKNKDGTWTQLARIPPDPDLKELQSP